MGVKRRFEFIVIKSVGKRQYAYARVVSALHIVI